MNRLARPALLCLLLLTAFAARGAAIQLEKVTLQLKWTHAFQFAGYYAAKELGYYREAGLDVNIAEARPGSDPVREVIEGRAEFGVGNSSLLLSRKAGHPVTVLAVVFQHSPQVLVARQDRPTQGIHDLVGRRVMLERNSDELVAYLKQEGIGLDRIVQVEHSFDPLDLIKGRVDAISAYVTNEPYYLDSALLSYQTYTPRAAGIDFYGDNLFTLEAQIAGHPQRVAAFRAASLRGWQYAMRHPEEIADLIVAKYSQRHPREFYLYEARRMVQLLQPDLIEVGYMNRGRWQHIADTYAGLGLLPADFSLAGFLYDPNPRKDYTWLYRSLVAALVLIVLVAAIALYINSINQRLGRAVGELEREKAFAREVMQRLVRLRCDDRRLGLWSRPALSFSGDAAAAAVTPDGHIRLLLADCTGHGLAAALNVVPVVEKFYGLSNRGLGLAEVCAELNRQIHELMPAGRFVCAAIAEIDPAGRRIRVWNGGMPPVLCAGPDGRVAERWLSRHVALGILPAAEFDASLETSALPPGGVVLLSSDGLAEAVDSRGVEFGEAGLLAMLRALAAGATLEEAARNEFEARGCQSHDDVTALAAKLDP